MSVKYLIIIILLLVILYLYHKNQLIEHLTEVDSNKILEQLASIYNNDTLQVKNLVITNTLTSPNIETTNLKTYKIKSSNKNNLLDIEGNAMFYGNAEMKKKDDNTQYKFTIPELETYNIKSTDTDIYIKSNLNSPNDNLLGTIKSNNKSNTIKINNDVEFASGKKLKVKNIETHNIKPGYTEWVNVDGKLDVYKTLQNKGKTIDYVWSGMSSKTDRGYVAYYPK